METVETNKNLENVEPEKTVDSNDKEQDPPEEGEECSEDLVLSTTGHYLCMGDNKNLYLP